MPSFRSLTIPALAFSLLLAGCDRQSGEQAQPEPSQVASAAAGAFDRTHHGSAMPDFTLKDPKGSELQLKSLKGKPLLINLWATWCAPCIAELPALDRLAARGTVRVVTISQDTRDPDKVSAFLKDRGVSRLEPWLDQAGDLAFHYEAPSLPMTIYYDASGREVWRIAAPMEWDGEAAAKALAEAG